MNTRILIPIITGVTMMFSGMILQNRITKAPICNCPELPIINIPPCPEAISLQGLDLEEVKKLKIRGGFNYSPSFQAENLYIVQGVDTNKVR
jgi:hypothetical protein